MGHVSIQLYVEAMLEELLAQGIVCPVRQGHYMRRPQRSRRRSGPASVCSGRRRRAGLRGAGAAQVQDALEPALRPGVLGRLRSVKRHLGAAGQPH